MAPSRIGTLGALAVALVAAVIVYFIGIDKPSTRSEQSASLSDEVARPETGTKLPDQQISTSRAIDAAVRQPQPNDEQRIAAIKKTIGWGLGAWGETWSDALTQQGLARADTERIGLRFIDDFSDCIFDAARREYEVQGMAFSEFLHAAETASWFQTLEYVSSNRVRRAAMSCVANVSQQTGIPLPANFEYGGGDVNRIRPAPPVPPWATDMEARIRDHVTSYPEAGVSDVRVQCVEAGCAVELIGRAIRIFDLEFDVFAEQNGFAHALPGGGGDSNGNHRSVWLQH